jgi:hypothetical protein
VISDWKGIEVSQPAATVVGCKGIKLSNPLWLWWFGISILSFSSPKKRTKTFHARDRVHTTRTNTGEFLEASSLCMCALKACKGHENVTVFIQIPYLQLQNGSKLNCYR